MTRPDNLPDLSALDPDAPLCDQVDALRPSLDPDDLPFFAGDPSRNRWHIAGPRYTAPSPPPWAKRPRKAA